MSVCDIDTEVLDQMKDDIDAKLVEPVGLLRSDCHLWKNGQCTWQGDVGCQNCSSYVASN